MLTSILNIVALAMPSILKLVGMWIDNAVTNGKLDVQAKNNFNSFLASIAGESTSSARLRQSAKDQLASFGDK